MREARRKYRRDKRQAHDRQDAYTSETRGTFERDKTQIREKQDS